MGSAFHQLCPRYSGILTPTSPFFHKESKSNFFWWRVGCGGARVGGVGVDGRTDEQAQTNLPLKHLPSWGHNNAFMYKLCP